MSYETVELSPDVFFEKGDDIAALGAHLKQTGTDPCAVYFDPQEGETSVLFWAIRFNAVECVQWIKSQGADLSRRICLNIDVWGHYRDWAEEEGYLEDEDIEFESYAYTPVQISAILNGPFEPITECLRTDERALLRDGFDALYYLCFRKAFAPEGNAAKRARRAYEADV